MKNIKLTIEYDGTNYCGWQKQDNALSVETVVEAAIEKTLKEKVSLIGASRTDAGVHAKGQVANFFTETTIPEDKIALVINNKLPTDVVVLNSEAVPMDFHARYNTKTKRYSYTIFNRKIPPTIQRGYCAHVSYDLNFDSMKRSADYFLGTHDFSAFQSTGGSVKTSTRTIKFVDLIKDGDIIKFYIEGDGFLYNMVRIIIGTLINVGRGRIQPEKIIDIIESRDRKRAGVTAPASGLCLEKIYY